MNTETPGIIHPIQTTAFTHITILYIAHIVIDLMILISQINNSFKKTTFRIIISLLHMHRRIIHEPTSLVYQVWSELSQVLITGEVT